MTKLCIDAGNSLIKAGIFNQQDQLTDTFSFPNNHAEAELNKIIEKYQPAAGILCSVIDTDPEILQLLKDKISKFIVLSANTALPFMNAYHSPQTLGMDRLALVAGAYAAFPDKNTLIISLGTCITYNFLTKNRAFRGGAISPGWNMRLQAMHHFTSKLPQVKTEGDLLLLGYDTETGMRSGATFGMAAEIDGMVTEYASQYPDFNAVLTGGDAAYFGSKLKIKIFADLNLSLKGLNLILKHNVPQIH